MKHNWWVEWKEWVHFITKTKGHNSILEGGLITVQWFSCSEQMNQLIIGFSMSVRAGKSSNNYSLWSFIIQQQGSASTSECPIALDFVRWQVEGFKQSFIRGRDRNLDIILVCFKTKCMSWYWLAWTCLYSCLYCRILPELNRTVIFFLKINVGKKQTDRQCRLLHCFPRLWRV